MSTPKNQTPTNKRRELELLLGHSLDDGQLSRRLALARPEVARMRAGCSGGMMGFSPLARELVHGRKFGGGPRPRPKKPSGP